ncbi:MAG: hypothetical protein IJC48_04130 [Clostridia bacterium]|nr:hypothetical protein [Clostridia bacterium]
MKRILTLALAAMLCVCAFAFSEEPAGVDISEGVNISELEKIMDFKNILSTGMGVGINLIYYDDYGAEMFSTYSFAKSDENGEALIVYEDSEGNIEILTGGACAGFDAWSVQMYSAAFVLDEYERAIEEFERNFFKSEKLNEKIVSIENVGGRQVITTNAAFSDFPEDGYQKTEYILDEDGVYLDEYREYNVMPDGSEIQTSYADITMNAEYQLPEELLAVLYPEETRLIRVILNCDSRDEEIFEYAAPADVDMQLIYPEEYMLYEDKEGTRMYAGAQPDENGLYPALITLYLAELG